MANIILNSGSAFRIRRPPAVSNGFVNDLDPRVQEQLDTLHQLLSADVFAKASVGRALDWTEMLAPVTAKAGATASEAQPAGAAKTDPAKKAVAQELGLDPATVLELELTAARARALPTWGLHSLAGTIEAAITRLHKAGHLDDDGHATKGELISLSEYVDRVSDLSTLKYSLDSLLASEWTLYPETIRRVLDADDYPAIRTYLVAYAYLVLQLRDVGAVKNFILNDKVGAKSIANYATVGAARELVADKGFSIDGYDEDGKPFVKKIRAASIGLSTASFERDVMSVVNDLINDVDHKELIDEAEKSLGQLSLATRLMLARYIDAAPVTITTKNVASFAAVWLAQNAPPPPAAPSDGSTIADGDFGIETYQDDPNSMAISKSAVLCAAQLYYTMVLGDELDVFAVVHYFTHKYIVSGQMEISDAVLRQDLQNYVFSNRFTELKTGRILDRSRREERRMFHSQVFGVKHHRQQLPEGMIFNEDFPSLWKVLMLQAATYLEKAQSSLNPDAFVSRQQVAQAVEDLQYNLSTHAIGMATVASPLQHAELNFAIRRILMHPEVLNQVVPVGGTWWRAVEKLSQEFKHAKPRSTALYNKAKLGHDIIAEIAAYDPSTFEDDAGFGDFMSNVDAYITTQSILQQALKDQLSRRQHDPFPTHDGDEHPAEQHPADAAPAPDAEQAPAPVATAPSANGASANGHKPSDEWDF
jgi:hypothetical protein